MADYQDDGQVFNGSIGADSYLANTIFGGLMGGGIGAFAGALSSAIPALGSIFSGGAATASVAVTSTQIATAGAIALGSMGIMFSKNASRFGKSKIGSNEYYNRQFNEFWNMYGNGKLKTRRDFHDYITKKGYNKWKELFNAWLEFKSRRGL